MVIYTIISLLLALLTEVVLITGLFFVRNMTKSPDRQIEREVAEFEKEKIEETKNKRTKQYKEDEEEFYRYALKSMIGLKKPGIISFLIFMIILGMVLFVIYFMLLTRSFTGYLQHIKEGIVSISQGNFDSKLEVLGN